MFLRWKRHFLKFDTQKKTFINPISPQNPCKKLDFKKDHS